VIDAQADLKTLCGDEPFETSELLQCMRWKPIDTQEHAFAHKPSRLTV
jgi:hypothetical protein